MFSKKKEIYGKTIDLIPWYYFENSLNLQYQAKILLKVSWQLGNGKLWEKK